MVHDIASALFGVEGLQVVEAEAEADGTLTVWAVTGHPGAAVCPGCGTRAGRVHEHVLARPRDLRRGLGEVPVCWLKRRWKCEEPACGRKTFTESLPEVPAGCRLTGRRRQLLGAEVTERGCTPAEAARWQHVPWPAAHDAIEVAATGMCTIYAPAVRRMLPHAQIAADLFHVVLLAVKMTGDVRRRAVREKYGRRGRSGGAGYGIKGLLVRNLEHLRPGQFARGSWTR